MHGAINCAALVVDTLEFCIAPSKSVFLHMQNLLFDWKKVQGDSFDGHTKLYKKGFCTRLSYFGSNGKMALAIELGFTKSAHRYARFSFQPGSVTSSEWVEALKVLAHQFQPWDYSYLLQAVPVSRIDFAVDLVGVNALNVIPHRARTRSSHFYVRKDGSRGTLYLGSQRSQSMVRIYDRIRKQLRGGIISEHAVCTRVEVQLRRLAAFEHELAFIAKPFLRIGLANLDFLNETITEDWQVLFLDRAQSVGTPAAFNWLSKHRKVVAKQWLHAASVPYWDVNKVWADRASALSVIGPKMLMIAKDVSPKTY